jgi:hypothetical protein
MNYLRDPHGYVAHDTVVKALFGLDPKAKWPVEGIAPRIIQGITCWVEPLRFRNTQGRRPAFGLRAMCKCPECGKTMPIGRLAQHARRVHNKGA